MTQWTNSGKLSHDLLTLKTCSVDSHCSRLPFMLTSGSNSNEAASMAIAARASIKASGWPTQFLSQERCLHRAGRTCYRLQASELPGT